MFEIAEIGAGANRILAVSVLLPFLGAAVLSDVSHQRVPNCLVALMFASGIVFQVLVADSTGSALLAGFGGACIGLLILLPFYVLGGMGAGDVKLLAATGSFLGPQGALVAGLFTLGAGAIFGVTVILCRQVFASLSRHRLAAALETTPRDSASIQLPYSVAIAAGSVMAVMQW